MLPDLLRLRHMLEAAEKAVSYMEGKARADLDSDELRTLAVLRLLEIIGEAAKAVSPETQALAPHVPWRLIGRTRDRLIHGYFNVDLDVVWQIVSVDLPPLLGALRQLEVRLAERPDGGEG